MIDLSNKRIRLEKDQKIGRKVQEKVQLIKGNAANNLDVIQ